MVWRMYACTCWCMCNCVIMHLIMHVCMFLCMCMCAYVPMYVCVCSYVHVCVHVCVWTSLVATCPIHSWKPRPQKEENAPLKTHLHVAMAMAMMVIFLAWVMTRWSLLIHTQIMEHVQIFVLGFSYHPLTHASLIHLPYTITHSSSDNSVTHLFTHTHTITHSSTHTQLLTHPLTLSHSHFPYTHTHTLTHTHTHSVRHLRLNLCWTVSWPQTYIAPTLCAYESLMRGIRWRVRLFLFDQSHKLWKIMLCSRLSVSVRSIAEVIYYIQINLTIVEKNGYFSQNDNAARPLTRLHHGLYITIFSCCYLQQSAAVQLHL